MKSKFWLFPIALTLSLFPVQKTLAHCDTKNGPVVKAAEEALKKNNVNLVLIWVQSKDESIIKEAFKKTIDLRKLSPAVREVVDNYFFEILVRIHRAGEGAGYTGLKDSTEIEAPIAAADHAIEKKSITDVMNLLNDAIRKGINVKFKEAISKNIYDIDDVDAGREYVESYVAFLHYIEAIYNASSHTEADHHEHENAPTKGDPPSVTPTVQNASTSDHLTHILIIAGTLSIIIIQVFLSYKKP